MGISISGLASGLDTAQIIEQLMAIERRPVVLWTQRQQVLQSKLDAWRDVNKRLAALDTRLADLQLQDAFLARVGNSSNESVATAQVTTDAALGTYDLVVTQLAAAHRVRSDQYGSGTPIGTSGTVTVNGIDITVDSTDTLADLADKINQAGAGVSATLIEDHLVLTADQSGTANTISLSEDGGGVFSTIGLLDGSGQIKNELQAAADADFAVNGVQVIRSSNTVNDVVQGVTFNLQGTGSATITVEQDTEAALESIKAFVEQYNSTFDYIREQVKKEGTLQGETVLIRLQTSLRQQITDKVAGQPEAYNQLALIGITTDREGRLHVDEAKLKDALENDAQAVGKLFAAQQSVDGYDGLVARSRGLIETYIQTGGLIDSWQGLYEGQIESLDRRIEAFELRLAKREENLVRQFTELEQALALMQSQSAWLSQQIEQLGSFAAAPAGG